MRGYLKLFLLTCILCNITTAWATKVGDACNDNNPCIAGQYCATVDEAGTIKKCASCSDDTGGAYPNSVAGTTNIGECYVTCTTTSVPLGTKKTDPENKQIKQSTGETCKYTLQCVDNAELNADGTACECMVNYEANTGNTECIGKCYTITLDNNLNSNPGTQTISEKYGTGFYNNNTCSGDAMTDSDSWTIPTDIKWWQKFNGYYTAQTGGDQRFGPDGRPADGTNDTTFTKNTTLYAQWEKNDYTVKYQDGDTVFDWLSHTCRVATYDATEPSLSSDSSCPAQTTNMAEDKRTIIGWSLTTDRTTPDYEFNDNIPPNQDTDTVTLYAVWGPCPAGYYCDGSGKHECPAGATAEQSSSSIADCYISGETKFRDNLDTFTLPIGTITYQ